MKKDKKSFLAEGTFVYRGPMAGGTTASGRWTAVWGGVGVPGVWRGSRPCMALSALRCIAAAAELGWVEGIDASKHISSDC